MFVALCMKHYPLTPLYLSSSVSPHTHSHSHTSRTQSCIKTWRNSYQNHILIVFAFMLPIYVWYGVVWCGVVVASDTRINRKVFDPENFVRWWLLIMFVLCLLPSHLSLLFMLRYSLSLSWSSSPRLNYCHFGMDIFSFCMWSPVHIGSVFVLCVPLSFSLPFI